MQINDFIHSLQDAGFILRVNNDNLEIQPAKDFPPNLIPEIKKRKTEIIHRLNAEIRRQRVIKILADNPPLNHACRLDDSKNQDPDYYILTLAIKNAHSGATCDLMIPRGKHELAAINEFIRTRTYPDIEQQGGEK
jgi:hypothetical protein